MQANAIRYGSGRHCRRVGSVHRRGRCEYGDHFGRGPQLFDHTGIAEDEQESGYDEQYHELVDGEQNGQRAVLLETVEGLHKGFVVVVGHRVGALHAPTEKEEE